METNRCRELASLRVTLISGAGERRLNLFLMAVLLVSRKAEHPASC